VEWRGIFDPDFSIALIVSPDLGDTWPAANRRTLFSGRHGVNDPALTVLRDGTVLMRFTALDIRGTAEAKSPPAKIFSHRQGAARLQVQADVDPAEVRERLKTLSASCSVSERVRSPSWSRQQHCRRLEPSF